MSLLMRKVLVLSAKRKKLKIFDEFFISFIYNKQRISPRILPCGAPHVIAMANINQDGSSHTTVHCTEHCTVY